VGRHVAQHTNYPDFEINATTPLFLHNAAWVAEKQKDHLNLTGKVSILVNAILFKINNINITVS
jgi:hypothetical protein